MVMDQTDGAAAPHVPVMVGEVLQMLQPEAGGVFVDCTVGLGGHTRALLDHGASRVIGLDRDRSALALTREALADWGARLELVHADYRAVGGVLDARGVGQIDGALADLGVSSMQLDAPGRGFSFRRDEPLDMRMDTTDGPTAADLLARVEENELADVIYEFGEERHSRRIARALVAAREHGRLETTGQVAAIVRRALARARGGGWQRIDPATRTFQALRIWVNRELEGLDSFLTTVVGRLNLGRRLAVITFHSLEDRIVKHTFRALASSTGGPFEPSRPAAVRILTKRPLAASDDELARNPRARSAKLRAVERV
jgi:16S rRNA (cytosine1402-N4)-methyltransferase